MATLLLSDEFGPVLVRGPRVERARHLDGSSLFGVVTQLDRYTGDWAEPITVLIDRPLPDVHSARQHATGAESALTDAGPWWSLRSPTLPPRRYIIGELGRMLDRTRSLVTNADNRKDACTRLERWLELTGSAYTGTPGIAGVQAMRDLHHRARGRRVVEPLWMTQRTDVPDRCERDYTTSWKPAPGNDTGPIRHTYDVIRMYLAAAITADLPHGELIRTDFPGPVHDRDTSRTGLYLVDAEPWRDARIPDPAGYGTAGRRARWMAAQTVDLLSELREQGKHPGFSILSEMTGRSSRLLRPWGERIRTALDTPDLDADTTAILKRSYREAIGLFNRPGGRIYRPDWRCMIIAQARVTLWRKMWAAGTRPEGGRWPLSINVDAVTYAASDPDPTVDPPLPLAERPGQLGRFRVLETQGVLV